MSFPAVVLSTLIFALACTGTAAAAAPRLVRVQLDDANGARLLEAGLDVVDLRAGRHAMILAWPGDEAKIQSLGFTPELVDAAPGRTIARRTAAEIAGRPRPEGKRVRSAAGGGTFRVQTLPPFGSGSMGGYWTLAEVRMKLDDLVASDVNDVVADQLDTLGWSRGGRPILGLELGKPVAGPDPRPVAFLSSLNHAREPMGMQSVFYFADHLLSRYGTDPFATYLLDQRRIVLLPLKNPDGFWINDSIYAGSGGTEFGYWRKNARDNNGNLVVDFGDGVDLNRNYGYKWGNNNVGSSANSSSETYRGPSAFSEPETQAHRDAVIALQPATGLSFHSYGDYFLHPWGWTVPGTPDSLAFYEWSDEMTLGTGYQGGPAPRVLYEVNGEFNDWCYGDTLLKPKMFSWTPEVGTGADGFWPLPSRIEFLALENLMTCYTVAAIAGPYVRAERITLDEGVLNAGHTAHVRLRARNLGRAAAPAGLTATLAPLDAGVTVLTGAVGYPVLAPRSSAEATAAATITIAAFDSVTPGRRLRLLAEFSAPGGFYSRDTVEILAGTPTVLATEDFSGTLGAWHAQTPWAIVNGEPAHPGRFAADSPASRYGANLNTRLTRRESFDLSAGVHAWALFDARWMLETDYDATLVEASLDSVSWTPLPARATVPGEFGPQPGGLPVFEGTRSLWRPERVDLSAFTGPAATRVWLRFRTVSDGGTQYDGFNFDSLRVLLFDPAAQPAPVAVEAGAVPTALALSAPTPQPARHNASFAFALPEAGHARLDVSDLQGRRMRTLLDGPLPAGRHSASWNLRDDAGRRAPPGVYFARLVSARGSASARVLVLD